MVVISIFAILIDLSSANVFGFPKPTQRQYPSDATQDCAKTNQNETLRLSMHPHPVVLGCGSGKPLAAYQGGTPLLAPFSTRLARTLTSQ